MPSNSGHALFRGVTRRKAERQAENDATLARETGWEDYQRFGNHDRERVRLVMNSLKAQGYETRQHRDPSGDIILQRRRGYK